MTTYEISLAVYTLGILLDYAESRSRDMSVPHSITGSFLFPWFVCNGLYNKFFRWLRH